MGQVQRAHLVIQAGEKDLKELARAVDEELQQLADKSETREIEIVYNLPADNEGQVGDRRILIDSEGEIDEDNKNQRYLLIRFDDGWYRYGSMVKAR